MPSPHCWPCCGGFFFRETYSTEAISPSTRQPQPCTGLCSSQEAKAATAGVSPASGICIKPSCSAGALLLSLARLVTYSQTPLDLEVSTLHLPPAYDPIPVLDYSHKSRFSHLPLPAYPAERQHKDKGRTNTHHHLAPNPMSSRLWGSWGADQAAEQWLSLCGIQVSWGSGESQFSRHHETAEDKVTPP